MYFCLSSSKTLLDHSVPRAASVLSSCLFSLKQKELAGPALIPERDFLAVDWAPTYLSPAVTCLGIQKDSLLFLWLASLHFAGKKCVKVSELTCTVCLLASTRERAPIAHLWQHLFWLGFLWVLRLLMWLLWLLPLVFVLRTPENSIKVQFRIFWLSDPFPK